MGEEYMHLAEAHGAETAGKIVAFTLRNLEKMHGLVDKYDALQTMDMERIKKLRVLADETFHQFKTSIARLERDYPTLKGLYRILEADIVLKVRGSILFFFFSPSRVLPMPRF